MKRVKLFTIVLIVLAAATHLGLTQSLPPVGEILLPWWVLTIAFALVEMAVSHLHVRRTTQTFSLSEVPLVIGLFFASPATLIVSRVLGAALALYFHRHQRSVKLAFNLGSMWLEVSIAVVVFHALLGGLPSTSGWAKLAAFAAAMTSGLLGTVLVGTVTSLVDGALRLRLWRRMIVTGLATFGANSSLGLVAVAILQVDITAGWYLLIVAAVVFAAYRGYSGVHRRHEDLELLYDFTRDLGGAVHVEGVGLRLLQRAQEILRAEHAELILESPDQSAAVRLIAVDGRVDRVPDSKLASELRGLVIQGDSATLPRTTKDAQQRAFLTLSGLKDALLVRLDPDPKLSATVLVGDRLGDVSTFTAEDVRLLQTLANHASVALANGRLVDRLTLQATEREHEALHDALTGLPNRRLFHNEVAAAITRHGSKAAVLLMDLNGFKDVNDTLGHEAGDELLRDIGGRLERTLEGTGMVARLGGDEFAVLLPGVGGELAAKNVARELLAVLEQQTMIERVRVDIGASIGISLCPAHGSEATTLLRRADVAMYSAKDKHSQIEIYDPERDHHSPERLALVGELRTTLDRGDLRVVYQPKADLRTGRVMGVEALARWHHPERGFVAPEEFVAVAERSGLIGPLTRHVLHEALTQCRTWRLAGLPMAVSVNISARSLVAELPREVALILHETGVAASALTLEITESSIMADPEHTGQVLEELSAMGVGLAIDDFGTGYSSLTYLKRLPVDEIKIDKSFVLGMANAEDDAAIVRSTVDLGRNLGLRVVAEGIEDAETWTALTTLGCDMAQGYFLSPPLTTGEFDLWLSQRSDDAVAADGPRGRSKPLLPPVEPPARREP
jgi:diguanylate cyclase (GGDEF)-like protein